MSTYEPLSLTTRLGVPISRTTYLPDGQAMYFAGLFDEPQRLYVAKHDKAGYFYCLPGEAWPLYSRYSLGMREMARDRRRRRRR